MQAVVWFLALVAPALSYKILYVSPINASSHHMWNTVIATELAKRGHQVNYIAAQPLKQKPPPNMNFSLYHSIPGAWDPFAPACYSGPVSQCLQTLENACKIDCEHMFEEGPFHDLIHPSNKDTYDGIIWEYSGHHCLLALAHRFKAPMIIGNPLTYNAHWLYRIMGVPLFHLAPHGAHNVRPPLDFWKRIEALGVYMANDWDYYTRVTPYTEKTIKKYFGEDAPSLKELAEKVDLAIVNSPDWLNRIPLPANVLPIGGIHLEEAKPLSAELEEFVNGAEHGFILISFGTCIPVQNINIGIFQAISNAVGKLPQRVLWKWDKHIKDDNLTFADNILRLPWMPQNDLLGHPKMRLFVSHCGGQSSLEAAFHGVPVLAIPGFWDQNENANRIVSQNAGIRIDFKDITADSFLETATTILNNAKYSEGARRLKSIMRNQPIKPLDLAIYWIESVIRNQGAPHLRPLLWDVPHPYTLLADIAIIATIAVISVVLSLLVIMYCLRGLITRWRYSKSKVE